MARPLPLYGRLETHLLDFARWAQRAKRDNRYDDHETRELVERIVEPMLGDVRLLVKTTRHVTQCFQGAEGMDSINAQKSWDTRQEERYWEERNGLWMLPSRNGSGDDDLPPDGAAMDGVAA